MAVAVVAWTGIGAAQAPPPEKTLDQVAAAQALFHRGIELMDEGKSAEACPKFEAAMRLEGTRLPIRLRLADCYEKAGRLLAAWRLYVECAEDPSAAGQPQLAKLARERAEALDHRLPRLRLTVPPLVASLRGVVVRRDGLPVDASQWGVAIPVEAGTHAISTSAYEKRTLVQTVEAQPDTPAVEVLIAELPVDPVAERLDEAERLTAEGNLAGACDKLGEAHALDAAVEVARRLAQCRARMSASVHVNFTAANAGEKWVLRGASGQPICEVPCSGWFESTTGLVLTLDAHPGHKEDRERVNATNAPFLPGRTVDARLVEPRGSLPVAAVLAGAGVAGIVVGLVLVANPGSSNGLPMQPDAGWVTSAVSSAVFVSGLALAFYSRGYALEVNVAPGAGASRGQVFVASPGFLGLSAPTGARVGVTPAGLAGAF